MENKKTKLTISGNTKKSINLNFSKTHGKPPGNGAAILSMGSLGGKQLNSTSDLDLIIIYDSEHNEISAG